MTMYGRLCKCFSKYEHVASTASSTVWTLPTLLIHDIILYFSTYRDIYMYIYIIQGVKNVLYFAINFGL